MHCDEALRDKQSQLCALGRRHRGRHFREFIEHPLELIRWNPASRVRHTRLDHAIRMHFESDSDLSARWRELNGISDNIPKYLLQLVAVSMNLEGMLRRINLDFHLFLRRHSSQTFDDEQGDLMEIQRFEPENLLLHVEARPVQELIDDSGQPGQVVPDAVEVGLLTLGK